PEEGRIVARLMRTLICHAMPALLLAAANTVAQPLEEAEQQSKTVRIVRAEVAPIIDGRLDDPVWQQAAVIDDFHQIRPGNGTPPSERSEIDLLYDRDNLYV